MARLNPKPSTMHPNKALPPSPLKTGDAAGTTVTAESTPPAPPATPPGSPDPEVLEQGRRRTFSAAYKLRILQEADVCTEPGEIGALLRREGLYSSHLTSWRRQRDDGALKAMSSKRRGPKSRQKNPLSKHVCELERDNARLRRKLEQAEAIIDIQKKVSELLGIPLNGPRSSEND